MTLWFVFALMTATAMGAVGWAYVRNRKVARYEGETAVYRDQLEEIQRDKQSGLIGVAEAEAARVEVARRLLRTAEANEATLVTDPNHIQKRGRLVLIATMLLLPIGVGGLYLRIGSPEIPSAPLAGRRDISPEVRSLQDTIKRVETRVRRNPDDGVAWDALARLYMRVDRNQESASAWQNALRLLGENADREEGLGEALVAAADGVVTDEARAAFERAVATDGTAVAARFYIGLAAAQDGRRDEASKIWRGLIAAAPAGADWVGGVRDALAQLEGKVEERPSGSGATTESSADQEAMIRGMVERLAARLKQNGTDVDGWLRLVRSYAVLGEREKARAAASDARKAIGADAKKLRQLNELVKSLGLET
jgi:cytochrome c-type biogenesis protein CcmH